MKYLITSIILTMALNTTIIFDFNANEDISDWRITDDVVMGGESSGNFYVDTNGKGVFEGVVSIENNGGFSSVRYRGEKISLLNQSVVKIRLKGDGKMYQFRIKEKSSHYYSFIYNFKTSGNWETIEIPLKEMYPSFRGRRMNFENLSANSIEEIGFLIGNKKNESFKLILDKIELN